MPLNVLEDSVSFFNPAEDVLQYEELNFVQAILKKG